MVLYIQSLVIFPTAPPHGNTFPFIITAALTLSIISPVITYFMFRLTEKTFLSKNKLIPTTKKKLQIK